MAVFDMHARGPLFEEFSEKLQEECDKHWKSGRQMCEVLSLTGNPCTNPIHKGGSEGAGGGEQTEPRDDDRYRQRKQSKYVKNTNNLQEKCGFLNTNFVAH